MIERKIYKSYAFTENESEKAKINREIYNELIGKYRIYYNTAKMQIADGTDCAFYQYDIIIGRQAEYHHSLYKIYKNAPNLTEDELALLCDKGSLCFGYNMQGKLFYIFED